MYFSMLVNTPKEVYFNSKNDKRSMDSQFPDKAVISSSSETLEF